MTRLTAVPTLLLVVLATGGASALVWYLTDSSGPSTEHGALRVDAERADTDTSPEAAISLRPDGTRPNGKPTIDERPPPGPALVARWDTERKRRRAKLSKRVRELTRTKGWIEMQDRLEALLGDPADEGSLDRLKKFLASTRDPVTRQNLIFLATVTMPTNVVRPWLQELRESQDPGDAEDALVALAFDGEPSAHGEFEALAARPADAEVRRLMDNLGDHDTVAELGTDAARRILRSYRAIEVLQRRSYFHWASMRTSLQWTEHPRAKDVELARSLRESWLKRYPGHPGSDDMAWKVGRAYTTKGAHFEAARWYALGSVMPDTDMTYYCLRDLLVTCELFLTPEDVGRISPDVDDPNFDLLDYVAMRKMAASRGLQTAIDHAMFRARREPDSLVGHAWTYRRASGPSKGLSSGMTKLPASDPLLVSTPWQDRPERPKVRRASREELSQWYYWRHYIDDTDKARTNPASQTMAPSSWEVSWQLREWETVNELRRRADSAKGIERADLLYKAAAVIYHNDVFLFPNWDYANRSFPYTLAAYPMREVLGELDELHRARAQFERESYAPYLVIRAFEQIEREHPEYPGMDKVVFSRGMAWRKLIDFWPYESHGADRPGAGKKDRIDQAVRELVASFEQLVREHPESNLADDAGLAAAHWREERSSAFGR